MEERPDYTTELVAMKAIADALATLPLQSSRERVLRWALAHFAQATPSSTEEPPAAAAPLPDPDDAVEQGLLAIDAFESLSEAAHENTKPPAEPATGRDAAEPGASDTRAPLPALKRPLPAR